MLFLLNIILYTVTLWIGLFLIARDWRDRRLVLTGLSAAVYALSIALRLLDVPHAWIAQGIALIVLIPALWGGALMAWSAVGVYLLGVALDLAPISAAAVVGVCLYHAAKHAQEGREALLPDLLRSLDYSMLLALLFGGQIGLMMGFSDQSSQAMILLLLTVIATALAAQVFAHPAQNALDSWILAMFPRLREQRRESRAAENAAARVDPTVDFAAMDEAEFTRLTRRALSHLGDLPRLAASPLTQLPIIEQRLRARGIEPNTLARAAELKTLLAERIAHLRPANGAVYGTSDEWRHYNALYYPYVAGLKPYAAHAADLDSGQRAVLEWFRAQVPERTLHNWQNAAARLVALDLREQCALTISAPQPV